MESRFIFPTPVEVFKDRSLLDTRIPISAIDFVGRKKQIYEVSLLMRKIVNGSEVCSLVYGMSGTGKTGIVTSITDELVRQYPKVVTSFYVNCHNTRSEYNINLKILSSFKGGFCETGWTISRIKHHLLENLKKQDKSILIILDEVDMLPSDQLNQLLYGFREISEELSKKGRSVSIILIANTLKVLDMLESRVRSRFNEYVIDFPPYNALELREILSKRIDKAVYKEYNSTEVISKCASIVAQDSGDARLCINTLNAVYENVEYQQTKVDENALTEALDKIKFQKYQKVVLSLSSTLRIAAFSIFETPEKYSTEIFNTFVKHLKDNDRAAVSFRRFQQILQELEKTGFIKTSNVHLGRYGRKCQVDFLVEDEILAKLRQELKSEWA